MPELQLDLYKLRKKFCTSQKAAICHKPGCLLMRLRKQGRVHGSACATDVTGSYLEGLSGEHSQLEAALGASQVHDLMAAYLVVMSSALYDSGCGHTQSPALL